MPEPQPAPEPQPVLEPPARAAMFLVVTVRHGAEQQVRDVLENLPGLQRSVAFRAPEDRLTGVTGIGSEAWDRLYGGPRPAELHPFRELNGSRHRAVATAGDLLFHLRARRMDLCFELARHLLAQLGDAVTVVDETHGFKYFDDRDLLGFVDGSENPTGEEAGSAVLIRPDEDPDFAGGSYVVVQKYLHDMAAWEALPTEEQERIIGRTKSGNIEMPDDVKPADSHVALNTVTDDDGEEQKIVRDNMPFGTIGRGEFGTYFIGYARTLSVIEQMLRNMFLGSDPGPSDPPEQGGPPGATHDRILDFSTAVTGSQFFVPPAGFFEDQPDPPGAAESQQDTAPAEPTEPVEPVRAVESPTGGTDPAGGSLGIGSLKGACSS
ncbi:putative deferrochelatase/peroxidase YfeX [Streptomyces sp. YIM 130001]|uniref:Dyp-type peroxidase n=1 Tax=Streptomyces sp. YIM 130001 TaxID=2259644 RepID=UPI000E64EB7F|nr:Dyp-type peroxidase [Streptomyces sp. YIM 130001]RII17849.1 putative deferrochelatase/peroxidase YfeX [Streptomyces sp. YIM 130001]